MNLYTANKPLMQLGQPVAVGSTLSLTIEEANSLGDAVMVVPTDQPFNRTSAAVATPGDTTALVSSAPVNGGGAGERDRTSGSCSKSKSKK